MFGSGLKLIFYWDNLNNRPLRNTFLKALEISRKTLLFSYSSLNGVKTLSVIDNSPVDTGRKLNLHKTFRDVQDVFWTWDVQDVFWTSYVRSIYVLFLRRMIYQSIISSSFQKSPLGILRLEKCFNQHYTLKIVKKLLFKWFEKHWKDNFKWTRIWYIIFI